MCLSVYLFGLPLALRYHAVERRHKFNVGVSVSLAARLALYQGFPAVVDVLPTIELAERIICSWSAPNSLVSAV